MKRGCVSLMAVAGFMLGAAAGQSGIPEPRQSTGGDDRAPEVSRPKSEPRPSDPESGNWGVFQGRVIFGGEPPAPRVLADPEVRITRGTDHHGGVITYSTPRRLKDYEVMAKWGAPITSERLLVDPKTKGVRNALVYLVRPSAVHDDARKAAPKILQFRADRGVFVPHVLAAMQGANILVTTDDPIVYHIDVRIPGTDILVTMDDSRLGRPQARSHRDRMNYVFRNSRDGQRVSLKVQPEAGEPIPMPVRADMHTWMSAWWLILDHPYFAITDERGNFAIRDVPTGPQEVAVWHESVDPRETRTGESGMKPEYVFQGEVVIQNGRATVKEIVIEPERVRPE